MFKIKFHDFPGDIPIDTKIALLEKKQTLSTKKQAKTFRKIVFSRTKAVLKERARKEILIEMLDLDRI
jgi:hypothetical protein